MPAAPRLDVFVYGTLMRGERNHERYCRGMLEAREAAVRGRLYDLPYGFPGLVVPKTDVLAVGTADYRADADLRRRPYTASRESLPGWDTVHGELLAFDDPEERLPALDALEGFSPGEGGFYERVLIPVTLTGAGSTFLAWVYVMESAFGVYLPGGRWPA